MKQMKDVFNESCIADCTSANITSTTASSLKIKAITLSFDKPNSNEERAITMYVQPTWTCSGDYSIADGWKPDKICKFIMHSLPFEEKEKEQLLATTFIARYALVEAMTTEIEDKQQ